MGNRLCDNICDSCFLQFCQNSNCLSHWLSLSFFSLWEDNYSFTFDSLLEHEKFSSAIRKTNKLSVSSLDCFFFCLGVQSSQSFVKLRTSHYTCKSKERRMLGKFCSVPLLLWLLVALFFTQIKGNSTASSSKVRLHKYRTKT